MPPPFTNVWDTTFPPDTQLANQLGVDIRNGVKVDVQQRMAAISGLDAAKPTFSADAQPANWNGILFFATDTSKIYQWNNPAWTDVTSSFVTRNSLKALNTVTQTGDTALHNIYTISVPGNFMGSNGQLRMTLFMSWNNIVGNPTVSITFGGTTLTPLVTTAVGQNGLGDAANVLGGNLGVTNSQSWDTQASTGLWNTLSASQLHKTSAIDTTVAQNLIVTYQGGNNADSATFYRFIVELI